MSVLRTLRTERNLSQAQVAKAVGVTPDMIGKMERGEKQGSVATLRSLSLYFGVPMDSLVPTPNAEPLAAVPTPA